MKRLLPFYLLLLTALPASAQEKEKSDPAATQLLAEARAARATWGNFPGFTADLEVNENGKVIKAQADVAADGKVRLTMPDGDLKNWTRRELASLVGHRLPGSSLQTPCAFGEDKSAHPLGRTIKVLNDELHSSYRIRDRQILEVNRVMGDVRFTISVLENKLTKAKKYLPISYVVHTWDVKAGTLKRATTVHNTWANVGGFELPASVLVVDASGGPLEVKRIGFQNMKLKKDEK